MTEFSINAAGHDRISAAIHEAERHSDAEIITIIAGQSDSYHDVGLHYAVAAIIGFMAILAAFPAFFSDLLLYYLGGWDHSLSVSIQLTIVLGVQITLFLIVRYALAWMPLRMMLTPASTKTRRVHRQAVSLFKACGEGRTRGKTAILLYLSVAEHRAEIVTDEAINKAIPCEKWGDAIAILVRHVKDGDSVTAMVEAIGHIGAILAEYVPATPDNPNEIPDRLIEI